MSTYKRMVGFLGLSAYEAFFGKKAKIKQRKLVRESNNERSRAPWLRLKRRGNRIKAARRPWRAIERVQIREQSLWRDRWRKEYRLNLNNLINQINSYKVSQVVKDEAHKFLTEYGTFYMLPSPSYSVDNDGDWNGINFVWRIDDRYLDVYIEGKDNTWFTYESGGSFIHVDKDKNIVEGSLDTNNEADSWILRDLSNLHIHKVIHLLADCNFRD